MNNNQVVAKVGDREIIRREVEEVLRHVDRKVAAQFAGPDGIKKLVTQMAQQELFYLDAKEKGLDKDDAFIKELEKLGGIPKEFIEDKELFDFFEPILRADFEISEKNKLSNEPAIIAPIYAVMGNKKFGVERIIAWKNYTRSYFKYEIMDGGHFFIQQHPEAMAKIIKNCYG